jgi:hypothetical protein
MTEMNRSIQPLLDHDGLCWHPLFHQIDFTLMDDGGIGIETALGFNTQHAIEIQLPGHPTMQIRGLSRLDPKALVIAGQILFQKPVGVGQAGHSRQAHLLDQAILKRPKQPFNPSLGRRGMGMNDFDP